MKKILLLLLSTTIFCVAGYFGTIAYKKWQHEKRWEEWKANAKDTASPSVTVWRDSIHIPYQDSKRTVHVYLPPGYATDTLRYPVIYLLDGDGCCSDKASGGPELQVDEVIDSVVAAGGPGAIVFGIESAEDRDAEYTPWPTGDVEHAHGEAYVNWLAGEFKPWVDANYRTRPEVDATTIGGLSRSGMMAYYALVSHPETFGNALIMSPSMWVDEERLLAMTPSDPDFSRKRALVSVGQLETPMVPLAEGVRDKLTALGVPADRLRFRVFEGFGHEPMTWRHSFALAYPWIVTEAPLVADGGGT